MGRAKTIWLALAAAELLLLPLASPLRAEECANRTIRQEMIIEGLPPFAYQENKNFCYGFAAKVLLQHHFCRGKGGCVYREDTVRRALSDPEALKQIQWNGKSGEQMSLTELRAYYRSLPDDELSVLDIIRRARQDTLPDFGPTAATLEAIAKEGRVALESCSNFGELHIFSKLRFGSNFDIWEELSSIQNSYLDGQRRESYAERAGRACEGVARVRNILPHPVQFEEVLRALAAPTLDALAARVMVSEECRARAVALPPFQVRTVPNRRPSKSELFDTITKLLRQDKPVMNSHCVMVHPESGSCLGWHANVISGRRQLCCGGEPQRCRWQFKLVDSAKPRLDSLVLRQNPGRILDARGREHGWEDADEFMEQILINRQRSRAQPLLTWIE